MYPGKFEQQLALQFNAVDIAESGKGRQQAVRSSPEISLQPAE